jgi:hypothetical protein
LKGVHRKIERGTRIAISRPNKQEEFMVVWAGEENTPMAGQIGASTIDPHSTFWNDVLKQQPTSEQLAASISQPKAKAQGA